MQKNVASQVIGAQMVSATDGSAFTGSVTVYVTGDAGTQAIGSVGSGACTHEGNGYHTYAPAQAETNYDLIAFTFIGTGAVPATVQVFTSHDAKSVLTGGITTSSFASGAIDAAALAADAGNEIADAILLRNMSNVEGTAGEHTLCTLVLAALEFSISGTTWTIKRTDGSTTHATKTLTTNASAEAITAVT